MAKVNVKTHNKLVRDGIPKKIRDNGEVAVVRKLSEFEKRHYLLVKLGEESKEALETQDFKRSLLELVDIVEAVDEYLRVHGISWKEFRAVQAEKRRLVGGFKGGTFLEETYRLTTKKGGRR